MFRRSNLVSSSGVIRIVTLKVSSKLLKNEYSVKLIYHLVGLGIYLSTQGALKHGRGYR